MNTSTFGVTNAGSCNNPEDSDRGIAYVFSVAERDGIGGLIALALPDDGRADSYGDRDRDGDGGSRVGDVRGHVCGPLCGRPFRFDASPGSAVDDARAAGAARGGAPGLATAQAVTEDYWCSWCSPLRARGQAASCRACDLYFDGITS